MQLFRTLLAVVATAGIAQAASIASRQSSVPDANCCVCDSQSEGYKCTVPQGSCGITSPDQCPYALNRETETTCCCCDPQPGGEPSVKCKAVPKDEVCYCKAMYCPFNWDISFLPENARP